MPAQGTLPVPPGIAVGGSSSGFANPMTTAGDLILGGSGGAATRLALGPSLDILTSNGTSAIWSTAPAQGILGEATQFAAGTILTNTNNGELWQATASGAALAFTAPTQATQVKWLTVDPSTFGYSLNVGQLATLGGAGLPLSTVSATTSLPVNTLTYPVVNGTVITTTDPTGAHTQNWTVTSGAGVGATSIAVSSQVANFAYPSGSTVTSATAVWSSGVLPSYSAPSSGVVDSFLLIPNYALNKWVVSPFAQVIQAGTSTSPTAQTVTTAFTLNPANGDVQSILLTDNTQCIITPAGFPTSGLINPITLRVKQPSSVTTGGSVGFAAGWTNLEQATNGGQIFVSAGANDKTNLFFDNNTSTPSSGSVTASNPSTSVYIAGIVVGSTAPF